MQVATAPQPADLLDGHRHPTPLEFLAGALVAASALLHVIAMFPVYFGGPGQASAWSQPDQAALYSMLAAGWVVALLIGLTGPRRLPAAAGMAVGLAVTELGFRLSDLGEVFRYGTSSAAAGLWLMTVAWAVGAAGAVVAVVAVRRARRSGASQTTGVRLSDAAGREPGAPPEAGSPAGDSSWFAAPTANLARDDPTAITAPASAPVSGDDTAALDPTSRFSAAAGSGASALADDTATLDPTSRFSPGAASADPPDGDIGKAEAATDAPGRPAPATIALVVVLAAATAGAFLPAWDHYSGVVTTTGRTVSFNLGNAFSGPWQVVLGTVLAAVAIVAVPIVAVTRRNRVVGAALISGMLAVLASQFAAAVVQVDASVPSSIVGLSPGRASALGLQLHLGLSGWFTVDLLVAFALFITAMVVAFARPVEPEATGP